MPRTAKSLGSGKLKIIQQVKNTSRFMAIYILGRLVLPFEENDRNKSEARFALFCLSVKIIYAPTFCDIKFRNIKHAAAKI
jgi:hypothetical protein